MLNVRNESIIADTSATTSGIRVTDHGSHWYCQGKYDCVGTFSKTSTTVVQITELPLKKWTQDYKEFLAYIRLHICVCVWVWRLYVELLLKCQQYFWISRFCIYVLNWISDNLENALRMFVADASGYPKFWAMKINSQVLAKQHAGRWKQKDQVEHLRCP